MKHGTFFGGERGVFSKKFVISKNDEATWFGFYLRFSMFFAISALSSLFLPLKAGSRQSKSDKRKNIGHLLVIVS